MDVGRGDSSFGAVLVAPFPVAQQHLLQLTPSCRGPAAPDSPVTPVPPKSRPPSLARKKL